LTRPRSFRDDCPIEAWNWLYSNGLVATDLEKQHRPGAFLEAKSFYSHYGFVVSPFDPLVLMMLLGEL
jgi:hypothetical protein